MITLITQIISVCSFLGFLFIVLSKIPFLLKLSPVTKNYSPGILLRLKNKTRNRFSSASFYSFLQKFLLKNRIFILRTENRISGWIEEIRQKLESANQRLMRVDTVNEAIPQSQPEVRRAMEDLRLASLRVLDQKEQSAHILTTINNRVSSGSFQQAYNLYAEDYNTISELTDGASELRNLNPLLPADRLTGTITVFQK